MLNSGPEEHQDNLNPVKHPTDVSPTCIAVVLILFR